MFDVSDDFCGKTMFCFPGIRDQSELRCEIPANTHLKEVLLGSNGVDKCQGPTIH